MSVVPVHTRTIGLIVSPTASGLRHATGRIRDLRHNGYTYTGRLFIGPGLVHDMTARLALDVASGVIRTADGTMDQVAFPGGEETDGESCRAILANVPTLAGAVADDTLAQTVRARIGRERGCYHLTNTMLALGAALRRAQSLDPTSPFLRSFRFDADDRGDGVLRFEARLWDRWLHGRTAARLALSVTAPTFAIHDVASDGLPADVAALEGASLLGGFSRIALERFTGPEHEPTRELALGLSAMVTQGMVTLGLAGPDDVSIEGGPSRASGTCWMWRHGGPAERLPTARSREPLPEGDPRFTPAHR